MWPTPRAIYGEHPGMTDPAHLTGAAIARSAATEEKSVNSGETSAPAENSGKGQLNPDWVEFLMNWPILWTSLDPLTELTWLDWSIDPADDPENPIPRVATGVKNRVARLKALGNGQVPACAAAAWRILTEGIYDA